MKTEAVFLFIGLAGLAGVYFYHQSPMEHPRVSPLSQAPKVEVFHGSEAELLKISFKSQGEVWTVEKVLQLAQLDQRLSKLAPSDIGQADGQTSLGTYVTLANAQEAWEFIKQGGYVSYHGPTEVRRYNSKLLEVEVEIINRRQQRLTLILRADGAKQGEG